SANAFGHAYLLARSDHEAVRGQLQPKGSPEQRRADRSPLPGSAPASHIQVEAEILRFRPYQLGGMQVDCAGVAAAVLAQFVGKAALRLRGRRIAPLNG